MPLIQGGLKIQIKITIILSQEEKLLKFKAKVEEVKYPMTGEYNDDSKPILNEIGVHNDEDNNADDDVAHYDEEVLEVEEQFHGDKEDVKIFDLENYMYLSRKNKKNIVETYFFSSYAHI